MKIEETGAQPLLPTKKDNPRSRYTNPLLLVVIILASLMAAFVLSVGITTPAHAFDWDDWHVNRDNRSAGDSDDWNQEWLGGDKYPTFDFLKGETVIPSLIYFLYGNVLEPLAGGMTDTGDALLEQTEDQQGWTLDLDNTYFHDVFVVTSQICENIIQPIAIGFLGLSLVLAFLEFSKEVVQNKQDHFSQMGSYIWILVKYVFIMTLINHSMLVCQGIYGLFLSITRGILTLISAGGIQTNALNQFMIAMQCNTYADVGNAMIGLIFALVILFAISYMVIQVFGTLITRMAEIYIMSAFVGFPLVMLTTDHMRQGGISYFKQFAAVCLQAGIVVVIVAFSGVFVGAATTLFSTDQGGLFGAVVGGLGILAAVFAICGLVKESKNIANRILGAA